MLTGRQIRDARALLHWNRNDLAKRSALPVAIIQRAEAHDGEADIPRAYSIVLKHAIVGAGVDITPEGVWLRSAFQVE